MSKAQTGKRKGIPSGRKGIPFSQKARENMSKAHLGKRANDKTKEKMSKSHTGKHPSDKTRLNMSEAHFGKIRATDLLGKHTYVLKNDPRFLTGELLYSWI